MKDSQRLREIPDMNTILNYDWIQIWIERLGRMRVKNIINKELSVTRKKIFDGASFSFDDFKSSCSTALAFASRSSLRCVINASGVVIHTNLGRSLIAPEAVKAMSEIASSYSNLEYDLEAGTRGQRNVHVEELLCSLTGAEASLVVNNNAGAVMLSLSALAKGREVIVSRGELVEIGGSFRIPDIMELSGAKLVEVGTTNRTHLYDYERAINENTSMLLKVHPSNFRIEGFTSSPERKELSRLAHEHGLIFMEDSGSGLMTDLPNVEEVSIKSSIEYGADVVTFSGDKMLGGPQIGGIAGRKEIVGKIKTHPMSRALRVDKVTLAGFEATLRLYSQERYDEIPTLRMLRLEDQEMRNRAEALAEKLSDFEARCLEVEDAAGGGSCPEIKLKGWGVSVKPKNKSSGQIQKLLRNLEVPIICGARDDSIIIHVRTLQDGEDEIVADALRGVLNV